MNREEAHNYNVMKNLARKAAAEASTDECDDLDFAMLTPPTRPGPCKAVTAPETAPEAEKSKKVERLPPMIDRAMAYIHQHAPCSIAEVAAAITRGNSWKPAQNAVGMLWAERRIVVRDNVITLPEGA